MTRPARLGLLAALYFAQGLPFGFFTLALPVLLRARGADLATVAASSLLLLPWSLKFLVAPVVDRVGTRKAWIGPLQVANGLALAGLAAAPGESLEAMAAGMFLVALFSSTQDIATDGLAVSLLAGEDRGLGNGVQVGAYRLGMVIGGGLVPYLYARVGPPAAFLAMAAGVVAPLLLLAPAAEPPRPPASAQPPLRDALRPWLAPAAWPWLAALVVYKAGDALATPMIKPMLVDAGWKLEEIGALTGLGGSSVAVLAAAAAGSVTGATRRRTALLGFGLAQAVAQVAFGVVDPAVTVIVEHFVGTFATVGLFTAMMDRCTRAGFEATDYTLQASVVVFATGAVGAASGLLAKEVGYVPHFAIAGALSAVGAVLAWRVAGDGPAGSSGGG